MLKILTGLSGREKWFMSTAAFCLVLAALAGAAWHFRLKPLATEWGDVATWVTAAVAFFGLLFTGMSLRGQTKQRREEQAQLRTDQAESRKAKARAVAVRAQWMVHSWKRGDERVPRYREAHWSLSNAGPYPITNTFVRIQCGDESTDFEEKYVGTVIPGQTIEGKSQGYEPGRIPFRGVKDTASVRFTDTWGQRWLHEGGVLTAISAESALQAPHE